MTPLIIMTIIMCTCVCVNVPKRYLKLWLLWLYYLPTNWYRISLGRRERKAKLILSSAMAAARRANSVQKEIVVRGRRAKAAKAGAGKLINFCGKFPQISKD